MSVPGGGGGWGPPGGGGGWGPPQPPTPAPTGQGAPAPAYGAPPPAQWTPPPSQGGGPPQGPQGGPPPGHTPPPSEPQGTWIGVAIAVLFLLGSVFSCLVTGLVAATESERFAMEVAYVTMPTVFAGLLPWIVALLVRKKGTGLAVGAPIGCGCLTWVVSLVSVIVFFEVIWPSL